MNKKLKTAFCWIIAFFFTLTMAHYQRLTGPTYPISGKATLGGTSFNYDIKRTHGGSGDHLVSVEIPDTAVTGVVLWKRYKYPEPFHTLPMLREGTLLTAPLPHQPPAGKLEYQVTLSRGTESVKLPPDVAAVIRFKGDVPTMLLIMHVFFMFLALMVAARAALAAFCGEPTRHHAIASLLFVVVGGLILGPFVQKYAFGAYWTGWPFGEDLTDNKTAVMALAWVIALWRLKGTNGEKIGRWWTVVAMVVMFAVYMIPHSMRGSEIDYTKLSADSLKVSDMPKVE